MGPTICVNWSPQSWRLSLANHLPRYIHTYCPSCSMMTFSSVWYYIFISMCMSACIWNWICVSRSSWPAKIIKKRKWRSSDMRCSLVLFCHLNLSISPMLESSWTCFHFKSFIRLYDLCHNGFGRLFKNETLLSVFLRSISQFFALLANLNQTLLSVPAFLKQHHVCVPEKPCMLQNCAKNKRACGKKMC